MKHDLFNWQEETANVVQIPKGRLRLRLSAPALVLVQAQGVESPLGFASEFDATLAEAVTLTVVGKARVWRFVPDRSSVELVEERFTNIDRMPIESENVRAVKAAMREMLLSQRQALVAERQALAAERKADRAERLARRAADPEPVIEPAASGDAE